MEFILTIPKSLIKGYIINVFLILSDEFSSNQQLA